MPPSARSMGREMDEEMEERPQHGLRVTPAQTSSAPSKPKVRPALAEPPSPRVAAKPEKPAPKARPDSGPVPVPVSVVPHDPSPQESDIRRLTRIIFSDIVIYGPEKADKAIRQGRFAESYKVEIEEGKKIIRARFPSDTASALETFQRCLDELLEARKKELQAAVAL